MTFLLQAEPLSEKGLLQGISVLEMCVLVAVKHVLAVYPDQVLSSVLTEMFLPNIQSDHFFIHLIAILWKTLKVMVCNNTFLFLQPAFNFEMAFHEYDKFATRKAKLFRYERSVVMKAR